jgi:hypothetical protein
MRSDYVELWREVDVSWTSPPESGAMTDWNQLIENCPGSVGGASPDLGAWGYVDVHEGKSYEAIQYLNHRGVRYLTPTDSPFKGCTRFRFKGGMTTGLVQRMADRDPNERIETLQEVHQHAVEHAKKHYPNLVDRFWLWVDRRKSRGSSH